MNVPADISVVHVVLNTDCNAWELSPSPTSPGVCKFCYRERNRVHGTEETVHEVIRTIRTETNARRLVFTGGEPLIGYNNFIQPALRYAKMLGFKTNIHTNGLRLAEVYQEIHPFVDVYTLAIDGADARTADWFRGEGYFERFQINIEMLVADSRTIALNTFTAAHTIEDISKLCDFVEQLRTRTNVDYWLISQYRPIGRTDARKIKIYGYSPDVFNQTVDTVRKRLPDLAVYAQPTRSLGDRYPLRVWVQGDGVVTADLGDVRSERNYYLGNCLKDGLATLIEQAKYIRDSDIKT
nr:radical SAM protein [Actinomyces bowdenii]